MKNVVINQAIKAATKDWNIGQIVQAVIIDEPEAQVIENELKQALFDLKQGNYERTQSI